MLDSMTSDPKPGTVASWWSDGFKPDPEITVSEWADKNRMLSQKASAEPGPWRTERTPYLREVMDCLSTTSPVKDVVICKGAQLGFTEAGNNFVGYVIDCAPGPMLMVMPTELAVKKNSRTRIDPLIAESPSLREKIPPQRSRDSKNATFLKEFPNGVLHMVGANSASALRSMPIRYLFLDEVDGYPGDVEGEGDPVELARARTRTFKNRRKVFMVSTPTMEIGSRIWRAFQDSDRRYYHVPCPHCGVKQKLEWERLTWPKGQPGRAAMICVGCGALIEEHHKTKMLAGGEWIADNPGHTTRGYHINSLYSPLGWYSWAEAAKDREAAEGNVEAIKTFTNTILGMPYRDQGDAPAYELLYSRREKYKTGIVPNGAYVLTAGIDVQKDRLEMEVVAWGPNMESWSVDYRVFPGDIGTPVPWERLEIALREELPHERGGKLPISMACIDTGYNTQTVYEWARTQPVDRLMAIKGHDNASVLIGQPRAVEIKHNGKRKARGLKVWPVGVSMAKTELYAWLRQLPPTEGPMPHGWSHFPEYNEEFFLQITAEQIILKRIRGYSRYIWEKLRERNEALDCRIYARVAAAALGVDRWDDGHWSGLRDAVTVKGPGEKPVISLEQAQADVIVRRPSSYWDR